MKRFAILVALVMTATLALPASAGGGAALLYAPTEKVNGLTLAEWLGKWETWIWEIPRPINPERHSDNGQNCALVDGVVFLASIGADCEIPANTPVAFTAPLATWECSTAEGLGETFEELTRKCTRFFYRDIRRDIFQLSLTIDGELVRGDRRWVTTTPGEVIDFPENDLCLCAEPGLSNSVTRGFFFITRPFSVGTHTIRAKALDDDLGKLSAVWTLEVV